MMWLLLYVEAFDPMEWLTIGLLIFGGIQIYVSNRTDKRAERVERERERLDAMIAGRIVFAESFRLRQVAERYADKEYPMLDRSLARLVDPEEMRIRDPSLIAQSLGRLGGLSANVGVAAIARADEAAAAAAAFNEEVDRNYGDGAAEKVSMPTGQIISIPRERSKTDDELAYMGGSFIELVREASRSLEDAVKQHPGWHEPYAADFIADPESATGKAIKKSTEERRESQPVNPPSWRQRIAAAVNAVGRRGES